MAAIVVSKTVSRWTGHEKSRASYLSALAPNDETARKDLETMVLGLPHFEVYGTTDTNTATSVALNLSDQGVTFPAGTQRNVLVRAYVAQAAETGFIEYEATVNGADGTTPEVDGSTLIANQTDAVDATADPGITVVVTSNEVLVNASGDTDVDTRWVIHVWVTDAIPLPFLATT